MEKEIQKKRSWKTREGKGRQDMKKKTLGNRRAKEKPKEYRERKRSGKEIKKRGNR